MRTRDCRSEQSDPRHRTLRHTVRRLSSSRRHAAGHRPGYPQHGVSALEDASRDGGTQGSRSSGCLRYQRRNFRRELRVSGGRGQSSASGCLHSWVSSPPASSAVRNSARDGSIGRKTPHRPRRLTCGIAGFAAAEKRNSSLLVRASLRRTHTEWFGNMTWLPKSVVCLSYYDRSRFRSDARAAFLLSLQIFPLAIAIAIAIGVHPLYGISCAAGAGLIASIFGDLKIQVSAPNVIFVAVAPSIVAREGILGLSLATLLAGVLLMLFAPIRLGA